MDLSAAEVRVLGALIEKECTTPQHYPLTENALVLACNQTTNRDPVVSYDRDTVRRALIGLRERGLAREVHRSGERAAKHRHLATEALSLDAAETALLGLLALRGPQTPGELRTRGSRMHPFPDVGAVQRCLDGLADRGGEPLVRRLERAPGQKEARYAHLLGEEEVVEVSAPAPSAGGPPAKAPPSDGPAPAVADLAAAVRALQDEVAVLRAEVAALRGEGDGHAG